MKWDMRGHQFDKIGTKFKNIKEIYIYGAGEYGADLYGRIKFLESKIIFVESNTHNNRNKYMGEDVISPDELLLTDKEHIVIVAASVINTEIILKKLLCNGYKEGENLFTYKRFCEFYLPIYAVYAENKSYLQDITLVITEKCTLKCKKCAPMYPYLKESMHRLHGDVIEDIDSLFSNIDYIWDLVVTGGEPFLHRELDTILNYIENKYAGKYHHIQIISNATIIPSPELCKKMSKMSLYITISNYTNAVPELTNTLNKFIEKLELYNVKYVLLNTEEWIDFGFNENKTSRDSPENMIDMFDSCNSSCKAFIDEHFVYCVPAYYSQIALGDTTKDWNNNFISNNKKEVLEYNMGYSEDGYLKMCRKCNGYITINHKYIRVAEQIE